MDAVSRLKGLRVLVLEDETLLAMLLEDVLAEFGCIPVGPFARCKEAIAFLGDNPQGCDIGILDVNVSGQRSDEVASEFDRLGLPFVFSTGYDDSTLDERWRGKPSLTKPFRAADLQRVLLEMLPSE
jgi:two-component SAPR family response regulator